MDPPAPASPAAGTGPAPEQPVSPTLHPQGVSEDDHYNEHPPSPPGSEDGVSYTSGASGTSVASSYKCSVKRPTTVVEPVLSRWDRAIARITAAFIVLCYAYFWVWFAFSLADSGSLESLMFLLLGLLMAADIIYHLWNIWLMPRMCRVRASARRTDLRIAMIVTKAPSEPNSMLFETISRMLNQSYEGPYDVWIADEAPDADMLAWCADRGVRVSTRQGVAEYHQKDWPRRTRCKEGNLCYFYTHFGYDLYDVVFQFDADHAPTREYLSSCISGFADDPDVAYMAFPSINGHNRSWVGRARTWVEGYYYGCFQPSLSWSQDGYFHMPGMTGSHYAVRTSALKSIGGVGPELDEDMSTTMMFASRGYRGLYSMDTIALGHGPEHFEAAMVQEFQWARSATILHFRWRHVIHPTYKNFNFWMWIRMSGAMYWYVSQFVWLLWFFASTVAASYNRWCSDPDAPCAFSILNFFLRVSPVAVVGISHELWARRRGWLRAGTLDDPPPPMFAPTISILKVTRTFWMAMGVGAGILELITRKARPFKVTPKGSNDVPILSVRFLAPIWLFFAGLIGAFWLQFAWNTDMHAMGLAIYAFIGEVGILGVLAFVVAAHLWENGQASRLNTASLVVLLVVCTAVLVVTAVLAAPAFFNAVTANLFIPYWAFTGEMILMITLYGIIFVYALLITFVV